MIEVLILRTHSEHDRPHSTCCTLHNNPSLKRESFLVTGCGWGDQYIFLFVHNLHPIHLAGMIIKCIIIIPISRDTYFRTACSKSITQHQKFVKCFFKNISWDTYLWWDGLFLWKVKCMSPIGSKIALHSMTSQKTFRKK
jgi:hypothetical protein